jgi:Maltose acetyltransferase
MARTEKDKMLAGELYDASAPEIQAELAATHRWLARYNAALDMAPTERLALLRERLGAVGNGAVIRPPFHCDYGFNIHLGAGVFMNFNCVILDVVAVTIGDRTQMGPGVQILAADHPRGPGRPSLRSRIWSSGPYRPQCLDRGRGDHSARRLHWRRRNRGRRRRSHPGCAGGRDRLWQPGARAV